MQNGLDAYRLVTIASYAGTGFWLVGPLLDIASRLSQVVGRKSHCDNILKLLSASGPDEVVIGSIGLS